MSLCSCELSDTVETFVEASYLGALIIKQMNHQKRGHSHHDASTLNIDLVLSSSDWLFFHLNCPSFSRGTERSQQDAPEGSSLNVMVLTPTPPTPQALQELQTTEANFSKR
ncbi:hypothetical protein J6590_063259 [Homalodisca vitripennis]|nr:hypothetical protein J6590_063259 [Homalodisca vitripennis]